MSELSSRIARLSPDKQALLSELLQPEAVAVIGIACRFPGNADSPQAYWRLLTEGQDGICEVPPDRWNIDEYFDPDPAAPGKMATRHGGFLKQVDQFDAPFFGITPREASRLDPQQRLLLEVAWESLENAGLSETQVSGSETGVFVGLTTNDYWWLQVPDFMNFDGHAGMGGAHCAAAGRISHFLNLRGPNMAVDTACSSSLVAVHLACQSLRTRECSMALAGGVNVMASPLTTTSLSKWGVLAPDGRCKSFDAAANGFARAEGCGMVVLKRLSEAQADGDNILAVIRGSAVNQDGRTTRFSAPNGLAQEDVLRKALHSAGVAATDVSFIEAHGTGTALGDPIEFEALARVYGAPRSGGHRCALGSVKANIGHTEAAAGVAGLIKAILCLQHGVLPKQLHFHSINPAISLDNTPFFIPEQTAPWSEQDGRRLAGVSSFGLSGTNAHLIVQSAPPVRTAPVDRQSGGEHYLLPVSARSLDALRAQAEAFQRFLAEPSTTAAVADICRTAALRRTHHPYRLAVLGRSREELAERLSSAARDLSTVRPCFPGSPQKLGFVFSGQGCQWIGMGRGLLARESVFRQTVERCDAWLKQQAGWSLLEELAADEAKSKLHQTEFAQPAIFAMQVGLLELYRSWGIVPDAVVGHSAGEVAAAYASGALTLESALSVVLHRARLMQQATGQGRMAAVGLTAADAERAIAGYAGRLTVAAINGPASTVLSGEAAAVGEVLGSLAGQGVFCKDLGVNYAFHTRQMDPFLNELRAALSGLKPAAALIPIYSTVTGQPTEGEQFDAEYWTRNMRQPVRFAEAIGRMLDDGCQAFLEIGPHPVLATPLSQCIKEREADAVATASLRQGQDDRASLLRSVGSLFAAGCQVDFSVLYPAAGQHVQLPNYAWQRKRYWISPPSPTPPSPATAKPEQPSNGSARTEASLLSKTIATSPQHSPQIISEYYDRVSSMPEQDESDSFLTFAPFVERVEGFSWLLAFYDPQRHPNQVEQVKAAQKQLREVLFRGIDFSAVRSMLDFGCGYGSDLIALAERHAHLRADGYTISPKQAEIGNRKISVKGLQDRAAVYHRDSSHDEFPGQYDLVFGFEVAHYIHDKQKLFAHIDRHLNDSGFIVLADFVANTVSGIDHAQTNSYIITREQWIELLSAYKLRLVECVDVSQEMANFLEDPNSDANLAYLAAEMGSQGDVRGHFGSYDGLGKLFRRKLASYTLFTIQKDRYQTRDEISRINREKISSQTPYAEVLQRSGSTQAVATQAAPAKDSLADRLWTMAWRSKPLPASQTAASGHAGAWLVLADQGGAGEALADLLRQRGEACITISRGREYQCLAADRFQIDPAQPEHFRELLADALTSDLPPCRGLIHLWGLDLTPSARTTLHSLQTDQALACGSVLHLAQAAANVQWSETPRIWIATRGAQSTSDAVAPALAQGPLWGLGRTIAMEQPALWGGLIDFDPRATAQDAARQLLEELLHGDGEDQISCRDAERSVLRLQADASAPRASQSMSIVPDATYLLTGGLGGLGLLVARWLVQKGARHLVLLQRSPLSPREMWSNIDPQSRMAQQIAAIQELESSGAQVHLFPLDVAHEDELARMLTAVRQTLPPLRGIIHTAGVLDDGVLSQLNWQRFADVLAPKLWGAWNLHRLTLSDPLDFFVLFSSAASLFGSPGQANYAAANAALDTLAAYRRQQGLPALSINWGPWSEVGMAAADAKRGDRVAQHGVGSLAPAEGIQALEALLAQDRCQAGVVPLNLDQLRSWPLAASRPFLAELLGDAVQRAPVRQPPKVAEKTAVAPAAPSSQQTASIRQKLLQLAPASRRPALQTYLAEQTAKILQLSPQEVDVRRPLNSLGIDSLMAVELRNRIESDLSVGVPIVSFLEGGSLADLVDRILKDLPAADMAATDDRMARALAQLNQMSDEAVQQRLAKQQLAS